MVEELARGGVLEGEGWRRAVGEVARHRFVPGFFEVVGDDAETGLAVWEAVSEETDVERWLRGCYRDATLVTQFDGVEEDWGRAGRRVGGGPSSSSTLPSLVVRMWVDADLEEGHSVLEVGTGTGYSTALACAWLGDAGSVMSVDVDPRRVRQAGEALYGGGYRAGLAHADGLYGYLPCAPYDRIVAACSVRAVPEAWIAQTREGGKILTTLGGWLYGFARVLLTVGADGTAEGPLLPGTVSFMLARPHLPPSARNPHDWAELLDGPGRVARYGVESITATDAETFHSTFLAQLAAPTAVRAAAGDGVWLIDPVAGAVACLTPGESGWIVREGGNGRIWERVERVLGAWGAVGWPGAGRFRVRVRGGLQEVFLPGGSGLSFGLL
ncbi:SAM-dependent methyltransferase [Actinocorallia sp. A-T 12471]|uniref:SAM-dependent methyltransferase n=1 Tax=Actinocorallia sp. A-T 12471 TaxID=3089813 RepID=UPI0029CCC972|nr:SAM-dependent methyltransferase [Actinocorallia sp. A-T 12471]MDX6744353.1 SAM-dependent methyltransferase [Actinocorallia sp. A-T 12471]